jgi:hypothetical protein
MPGNARLSTQFRNPSDFQHNVGGNYANENKGVGPNNVMPKRNYVHSKFSKKIHI